jgi:hypothetical protein
VSSAASPVVANWELVLRIRERKEQLGVVVTDITQALRFSRNYWSAIENQHKIIPENTLIKLFDILELGAEDREQLLELRAAAKENGWWSKYSALFDSDIQRLFGLEHGADQIQTYDTLIMPGLLQTADYARAVMESDATIRPVEVEQRVEARLRRQKLLSRHTPPHLTAIISEAALRQQVGGVDVLRDQLGHLLAVLKNDQNNIDLRVIPFTSTACGLFGAGTLSLLDFQSPRLPRVAWHESVTTWGVITDANKVRDIARAFNEARTRTLGDRETNEMITKIRREIS